MLRCSHQHPYYSTARQEQRELRLEELKTLSEETSASKYRIAGEIRAGARILKDLARH